MSAAPALPMVWGAEWAKAGVTKALEVLHKELDVSMALCGETDIHNVGPHILYVPQGFGDPTVLV